MKINPQLVRDIGEQGLLKTLYPYCQAGVVGDDGAVIKITPGTELVVTTDVLVDQVHFSDRTTSPEDVGWRAIAANLSDLAAMGATPLGITVGLSIPGDVPVTWIERLYQGMNRCVQQYNTSIVGGDLCRNQVITIAITAIGQVQPDEVIRRDAAKVGDAIVVTGVHGASRAGLELLLNPDWGQNFPEEDKNFWLQCHQQPQPRLDVLKYLKDVSRDLLTDRGEKRPVAGMDSSDGLADAVIQICRCSKFGATLDLNAIPLIESELILPELALEWALYGGEDFELVLCLPQQPAQALVKLLGKKAAVIGKITPENQVELIDSTGVYEKRGLSLANGFQHF